MYFFKNLPTFAEKPDTQSDQFFEDLLQAAEYLKMDETMRTEYDVRLKTLRDNYSAEQYLIKTTLKQAQEQAMADVAKKMLMEGIDLTVIARVTDLTAEQINALR